MNYWGDHANRYISSPVSSETVFERIDCKVIVAIENSLSPIFVINPIALIKATIKLTYIVNYLVFEMDFQIMDRYKFPDPIVPRPQKTAERSWDSDTD